MRIFGIVLAVGFVLITLVFSIGVACNLYFGWALFLNRILPRVTVDWVSVGIAAAAFVVFLTGVHVLGWIAYRRSASKGPQPNPDWDAVQATALRLRARLPGDPPGRRGWRFRWSVASVTAVVLLFAAGICLIGIVHQVVWLLTSDKPLYAQTLKRHRYLDNSSISNLREIGLGFHNYHEIYERLPYGGSFARDGSMRHSWETDLINFIGYSTVGIDRELPWNHPKNQPYFQSVLWPFINPEPPSADFVDPQGYGLSHYAANSRILAANQAMTFEGITDGTANTVLAGEVNAGFMPWGHPLNWRDPVKGINKSSQGFGGPPRSGGAKLLMADGSVRFVSERIDPDVLRALSTPTGGERIDPEGLGHDTRLVDRSRY